MNYEKLKADLRPAEGWRAKPYHDSVGVLTIGYGHNLTKGISRTVGELLLDEDIAEAMQGAKTFPWFHELDEVRQRVVVEMVFNLGLPTFKTFKGTIAAIERGDYATAAKHMLKSKWATQVKGRAVRLAKMMETGY